MAHIDLGNDAPGIVGLFHYRPETARPMSELVEVLLRGPSPLTRGERELIATYVSSLNECGFCTASHGAIAAAELAGEEGASGNGGPVAGDRVVDQVRAAPEDAPVSPKLKALLRIAGAVQRSGSDVTPEHVAAARAAGASDVEIHDTVLIAATFCLANRYVDGLAALTPSDPESYRSAAEHITGAGYRILAGDPAAR